MRGILSFVLGSLIAVAACGGSSDSPPGPLAKHFDEMYIAAIPLDQKQSVVTTQQDWNVARMENANADAQMKEGDSQLHQARNDQKATRLAIDSAVSAKKSADASADMNRINQSVKDLNAAQNLGKAADARVTYLTVYYAYLKRYLRYTQENMYWREAQFESAKAQLAKGNNIAPKGVVYESFPQQADARQKRTQTSKEKVEGDKQKAVSARENWMKLQESADKEAGKTSNFWDPMANKGGPATAGTNTSTKPIESKPSDPTPKPTPEGGGGGTPNP